jgi:hypothetical protein
VVLLLASCGLNCLQQLLHPAVASNLHHAAEQAEQL